MSREKSETYSLLTTRIFSRCGGKLSASSSTSRSSRSQISANNGLSLGSSSQQSHISLYLCGVHEYSVITCLIKQLVTSCQRLLPQALEPVTDLWLSDWLICENGHLRSSSQQLQGLFGKLLTFWNKKKQSKNTTCLIYRFWRTIKTLLFYIEAFQPFKPFKLRHFLYRCTSLQIPLS